MERQRPDLRDRYTTAHRAWKEARALALPPALAATPLGKRPYDLRHSALSTWLAAGADPAEVAQRAGNSVEVLLTRYAKCLYDRQSLTNHRIEDLLRSYDRRPQEPDIEEPGRPEREAWRGPLSMRNGLVPAPA